MKVVDNFDLVQYKYHYLLMGLTRNTSNQQQNSTTRRNTPIQERLFEAINLLETIKKIIERHKSGPHRKIYLEMQETLSETDKLIQDFKGHVQPKQKLSTQEMKKRIERTR